MQNYRVDDVKKELNMYNLLPETEYTLCVYFENEFKNPMETASCINFETSGNHFSIIMQSGRSFLK